VVAVNVPEAGSFARCPHRFVLLTRMKRTRRLHEEQDHGPEGLVPKVRGG
jgi:hypothetical protein